MQLNRTKSNSAQEADVQHITIDDHFKPAIEVLRQYDKFVTGQPILAAEFFMRVLFNPGVHSGEDQKIMCDKLSDLQMEYKGAIYHFRLVQEEDDMSYLLIMEES